MGLCKWFRKQRERLDFVKQEKRLARLGLDRSHGEREYPHDPGTLDGIDPDHLSRYEWAKPFCSGKSIMDYGCGVGYGSFLLSGIAREVRGYDISASALDWAKHYADRADNLSFAAQLPDGQFDCITCYECIEHVPEPEKVLDWLAAHAQEYVFISTPEAGDTPTKNKYHLREFSEDEFVNALSARFVIEGRDSQSVPGAKVMLFRCRVRPEQG